MNAARNMPTATRFHGTKNNYCMKLPRAWGGMKIGGDYMRLIDADALAMYMADWQLSASSDQYGIIEEAIDAVASAPTIDAVPATIEGTLGYLHKVGWMQDHDRIMTEDAVPVVRCKDCIYYQDNNNGYPHNECRWRADETPDATDFCSFGERKDK